MINNTGSRQISNFLVTKSRFNKECTHTCVVTKLNGIDWIDIKT